MLPPRSVRRAYFVSKYCKICLKFYYQLIQVNVIIVSVCSVSQLTVSAEAGHEPRAGREGRGVGGGVRPTQPRVVRALAVQTCSDTTNFFNVIIQHLDKVITFRMRPTFIRYVLWPEYASLNIDLTIYSLKAKK